MEKATAESLIAALANGWKEPAGEKLKGQGDGMIARHRAMIDSCFAFNMVEEILAALRASKDPWAKENADIIETRSPTSLKVSLAHLRMGKGQDFDRIVARDFTLAHNMMKNHDFYEGVRAMVIDKDRRPTWEPATLAEVTPDIVDAHFVRAPFVPAEFAA
jgi:enoyl-CoA hydratase